MNRWTRQLAAAGLAALFAWSLGVRARSQPLVGPSGYLPGGVVALRVVANSNGPQDQAAKLAVRSAVLASLARWGTPHSALQAQEMARTHQRALAGAADATLARLGLPYRAQVKVGWQPMPPKVWGSVALPAGTYPTVTVLLGRAQGQNWWCVVFPPLCLLDPAYAVSQSVPPSAPLAGPVRLQGRPQETSWWGRVLNWLRALGV